MRQNRAEFNREHNNSALEKDMSNEDFQFKHLEVRDSNSNTEVKK